MDKWLFFYVECEITHGIICGSRACPSLILIYPLISLNCGTDNLFISAEDFDLKKDDKENHSNSRKIDIVWATKPLKIEFAIAEISGPPNEHQHSHYFSDKIKIAKMLKIMLNRIMR
ncbi:18702_t:CDS:1, partial [Racocetra persica]